MSERNVLDADAWNEAWLGIGATGDESMRRDVIAAYDEPHRHYHTSVHLRECLEHLAVSQAWLEKARERDTSAGELALALWFHDLANS